MKKSHRTRTDRRRRDPRVRRDRLMHQSGTCTRPASVRQSSASSGSRFRATATSCVEQRLFEGRPGRGHIAPGPVRSAARQTSTGTRPTPACRRGLPAPGTLGGREATSRIEAHRDLSAAATWPPDATEMRRKRLRRLRPEAAQSAAATSTMGSGWLGPVERTRPSEGCRGEVMTIALLSSSCVDPYRTCRWHR